MLQAGHCCGVAVGMGREEEMCQPRCQLLNKERCDWLKPESLESPGDVIA